MINTISYLTPFLGLIICVIVVLTNSIDTKCPIRISKMCLWLLIWMIVAYHDYPYDALKAFSIMMVRVFMLIVNILYIVESVLFLSRRRYKKPKCKHAP